MFSTQQQNIVLESYLHYFIHADKWNILNTAPSFPEVLSLTLTTKLVDLPKHEATT